VDFTNLQRQVAFGTSDVGKSKSAAARERLSNLNPAIRVEAFETKLTSENALELFQDYDVIVDGTDNFPTRYLVNDACILLGKPNVYGSIFRFEGQATVFGDAGMDLAIAACIRTPLRQDWFLPAPKVVCWACCREL